MKSELGNIEKSIKHHLEVVVDADKKAMLEKELLHLEQIKKSEKKHENLEEVPG